MEINKSLFYPLTPFHLICSTILRNKLKYEYNVLVLDGNLFVPGTQDVSQVLNSLPKIVLLSLNIHRYKGTSWVLVYGTKSCNNGEKL